MTESVSARAAKASVIAKAKAHFKDKLAQGLRGPIHVSEWDVDVYYKPATTFHQESKVIELQQAGKTTEALIQTLINRALDDNGKNIFTLADKQDLMRGVDPQVMLKIVSAMNDDDGMDDEAVLGN